MSKDLFMMMREEEVATSNFLPSKKEIKKTSQEFAQNLIDSGDHNIQEVYAQSLRLKEAVSIIESVLKSGMPQENFEAFGLKGSFRNGGDSLNYSDDEVYAEIEANLKKRKEQLTLAHKQKEEMTIDGVYVPLVSTTPRKSSLAISF